MRVWVIEFAFLKQISSTPYSREEISKLLKIPERTLSFYLKKLKEEKIKEIPNLLDMRKKKFVWIS
ncbi:MAG: hypothetical protein J7L39_03585 [Candidatus Aenigmarchaeota archaeon]|nr:hypothetical protein [Candidatus Aenigmarchaeota archaeon]